MSDETVFRISMATATSVGVAVLSLIITVLLFWVGGLSTKVSTHAEDIASLKQCIISINGSTARIETDVREIRSKIEGISEKQWDHFKISRDNNTRLKGGISNE